MRPLKLFRRAEDRPTLKDRATAFKARLALITRRRSDAADPQRRIMVAGGFAATIPLPVLAAPAVVSGLHPDQHLLDAHGAYLRAQDAAKAAEQAYRIADGTVGVVLVRCPTELRTQKWEYDCVHPFPGKRPFGRAEFRWVPLLDGDVDGPTWSRQAWTGASLRTVIARAVPVLGQGGQTPFAIRRWKSLLPIADAFDADVDAAEMACGYHKAREARDAANAECERIRKDIVGHVATTPEGMAALVHVIGEYSWKDTGGAWPNLLRSAANASGVSLADLEHEYATTRRLARG